MSMTKEQFKQRRQELGYTQQALAEKLGCSLRAVQYYEGCGPRPGGKDVRIPGPVQNLMSRLRPRRKAETADAV